MLHLTLFLMSAIIMAYELVGARMLAPYLGTSIEVWAGLIAMILGGMSIGYWVGGRLADRSPERRTLAGIIFFAGIAVLVSWGLRDIVPFFFVQRAEISLTFLSIVASFCLFVPTTLLLGMVSPFVAKLSLHDLEHSAGTLGSLYATGAIGSLVGTVATSAWLIQHFGTSTILLLLAGGLIAFSFVLALRWELLTRLGILFVALGVASIAGTVSGEGRPGTIADIDTPYNRISIAEFDAGSERLRVLRTDPFGIQCGSLLDAEGKVKDELAFPYTQFFDLAFHFVPEADDLLMIGGCNYSYPAHVLRERPSSVMDVVELDPGMTEAAREYFSLVPDPRLHIIHEDARTFLNRSAKPYDVIFLDAFNSHLTVPFQLSTKEATERMKANLSDSGVAAFNFVGALEGPAADLFEAQYATLTAVFPFVYAFQVEPIPGQYPQNIMVIASKRNLGNSFAPAAAGDPANRERLRQWLPESRLTKGGVLTDDYAPVDRLGEPLQALFLESIR